PELHATGQTAPLGGRRTTRRRVSRMASQTSTGCCRPPVSLDAGQGCGSARRRGGCVPFAVPSGAGGQTKVASPRRHRVTCEKNERHTDFIFQSYALSC